MGQAARRRRAGDLHHSDTTRGVWAHDDDPDTGTVADRRLFVGVDTVQADGLAVDDAGNVWIADVAGSGGARAFSPSGEEVDRVEVPARMVTSVCFGGADRRDLHVVSGPGSRLTHRRRRVHGRPHTACSTGSTCVTARPPTPAWTHVDDMAGLDPAGAHLPAGPSRCVIGGRAPHPPLRRGRGGKRRRLVARSRGAGDRRGPGDRR
ncbi:MAG: SMP-30/gluconolactonase/LRE family protein [Ilumatobacteraceae bacterium]